ncbi:hypothetical protein RvY_13091 [Ramazzottius varieornatus]|uniref:Uncharacterized protein n=1 Tax=Ramazzottius varieornatus TaxID=947166 RepID=A0A1D1VUA4_RAMVA|nr:hypothetical protein RvY_13091 [Ramazzottius varieornatus]
MNDKPRDSLDKSHSPTSIDSGICTIANEEPEDPNALVPELHELPFQ